jgi:hypothetical protein
MIIESKRIADFQKQIFQTLYKKIDWSYFMPTPNQA